MRLRKAYIVEDQVLDAAGTVIKDLDFSDPITAIMIGVTGKKYDNANINPLVARGISKIEVVDGTDVLFSMNMELAQALQVYTTRRMVFNTMLQGTYAQNLSLVKIPFGRDDSDKEWALDPTKFNNPQIKVTYAFTEGAGYWADNEQKLTIAVLLQEEAATRPSHILMAKEFYSWTKSTSGDETIDMDRTYPYRMLLWSIKDATSPIYNELNKIKISADMDKYIPINEGGEDLANENANWTGILLQQDTVIGDGSTADLKAYCPFAWNWGANAESWNSGQSVVVKRPYSGYITVGRHTQDGTTGDLVDSVLASSQRAVITSRGYEPNFTEHLRFGNLRNPEEFLNPADFKSLRLILTQGGGDALVSRVVSQQLRAY